jgi:dUTP pyrophosphatase
MDLRAWLPEPLELAPLERRAIPTGLYLELPEGYEGQVRPRSGMALKRGLAVVNSPGTIDPDYRGELLVPVVNLSAAPLRLEDGDRIAQLVIARYERVDWQAVDALETATERGTDGFGSTGTA